jgi:putative flippase GtrA
MNIWRRLARFNGVGALGVGVQLIALWALTALAGMNYFGATLLAVGTAIGHNFLWHIHWTWRDRARSTGPLPVFAKFVAANGVVSFAGNAVVMAVLTGRAGMPPVPANLIAIGACALVNFWLGDRVVFRASAAPAATPAAEP